MYEDLESVDPVEHKDAFDYETKKTEIKKYADGVQTETQCKAILQGGKRCPNQQGYLPDGERSNYCRMHGAAQEQKMKEGEFRSNYILTKWQARLHDLANHDAVKSLRDEIAIARMLLENKLNLCEDANDLALNAAGIGDLVMKIEKVVLSAARLELQSGKLLDQGAIIQFGLRVVEIIQKYVPEPATIQLINAEMTLALQEATNKTAMEEQKLLA